MELDRILKQLKSEKNSTIIDKNSNQYKLTNFLYFYEKKFLKGKNVEVQTNFSSDKNDKFYFGDAFINFADNSFVSKDTKVNLHKKLFDKEREQESSQKNVFLGENDPRIYAISSKGNEGKIELNKAIFTSCKKRDGKCPPWSIKAKKITHDKNKKQLIYDHAVLNVYDKPVMYFPKFFHPDPSVERQTGFLKPQLNNSEILGSSLYLPYFYV